MTPLNLEVGLSASASSGASAGAGDFVVGGGNRGGGDFLTIAIVAASALMALVLWLKFR